jgi:hypothetical protein
MYAAAGELLKGFVETTPRRRLLGLVALSPPSRSKPALEVDHASPDADAHQEVLTIHKLPLPTTLFKDSSTIRGEFVPSKQIRIWPPARLW